MEQKKLLLKALEAQKMAKAPYSNYPVGAALLTSNNKIIMGCNVESKAYPTTLCAERVAIFSAIAQGYTDFKAIGLITLDGAFPCGSCRQILFEYISCGLDSPLFLVNNIYRDQTKQITIIREIIII